MFPPFLNNQIQTRHKNNNYQKFLFYQFKVINKFKNSLSQYKYVLLNSICKNKMQKKSISRIIVWK